MLVAIGWLVLGLAVLTFGAEILVRGAAAIAQRLGVSPLVVGLTIVAFGTSAPELVVSVQATLRGQSDVALGNVVGSNIFNILVILGLSAMIVPLSVARQLLVVDAPLMILVTAIVWLMALDGRLGVLDGWLLAVGLAIYVAVAVWQGLREGRESKAASEAGADGVADLGGDPVTTSGSVWGTLVWNASLVAAGLLCLAFGSDFFVDGAVRLARIWGMSELVIGLTIVAAGTSLPEVATSITAAIKGQREIAVGNVIGSNLFNLLGVLGVSAAVSQAGLPISGAMLRFDFPVMWVVAGLSLPIMYTGARVSRGEGLFLFCSYVGYTAYLLNR